MQCCNVKMNCGFLGMNVIVGVGADTAGAGGDTDRETVSCCPGILGH